MVANNTTTTTKTATLTNTLTTRSGFTSTGELLTNASATSIPVCATPTSLTIISLNNNNNINNNSKSSTLLTTITNTTDNKMSCSIEESNSQLDKQQQQSNSTSSSSTASSSTVLTSNNNTSNLISLVTPIQLQNATNNYNKPNNSINSNGQAIPAKIVQAGNQFIITTLLNGGSAQKVVTVSAPNASQNMQASSSSVGSSSSGSSSSASSTTSSSPQQHTEPTTTTITLTSPNPQSLLQTSTSASNSANNSASNQQTTILFPLQTHNPSQYATFVDASSSQNQTQSVSLFSPLGTGTSQYYTFQTTPSYVQQSNLLTTQNSNQQQTQSNLASPNRTVILQDHGQQAQQSQQQQQSNQTNQPPQQQNYTLYDNSQQSMDMDNVQLEFDAHATHTAQAAPITVQWLIDNFEPAEGCSLRRSTLYNYYIHHCNEQKIEPVNPASFGKLIRSVFLGLRTRRLGTRGNSKYHYYGIRVKINSPLNQLSEDHTMAIRNHPMSLSPTGSPQSHQPQSPIHHQTGPTPSKRSKNNNHNNNNNNNYNSFNESQPQATNISDYKPVITTVASIINEHPPPPPQPQVQQQVQQQQSPLMTIVQINGNNIVQKTIPQTTQIAKNTNKQTHHHQTELNTIQKVPLQNTYIQENQQQQQVQQDNGLLKTTQSDEDLNQQLNLAEANQIPNFGHINTDSIELPGNCNLNDVKKFEELYKHHCDKMLDWVIGLKLEGLREVWLTFWRCSNNFNYYEEQLPSSKFFALCDLPQVVEFVKHCDYLFYQFCIEILIPDVLGALPPNLVLSLRHLSKSADGWLKLAMTNAPDRMKQAKLPIINTFSMTLRRYTSLNHVAQTVKTSLQNEQILAQMLADISRVDFGYIREQVRWACGCDERVITKLENEFKESLRNYQQWSLEKWTSWLEATANAALRKFEGTERFGQMAKMFLLKWSFMCSSIVRDLTLRSAPTFGSFHLIRLLYDEYMYYCIEHKIANEYKQPALLVMSNYDMPLFSLFDWEGDRERAFN